MFPAPMMLTCGTARSSMKVAAQLLRTVALPDTGVTASLWPTALAKALALGILTVASSAAVHPAPAAMDGHPVDAPRRRVDPPGPNAAGGGRPATGQPRHGDPGLRARAPAHPGDGRPAQLGDHPQVPGPVRVAAVARSTDGPPCPAIGLCGRRDTKGP